MTFSKLNGVAVIGGAVFGVALFLLIYAFRDAFGAASQIGSPAISGRANSLVFVPGVAVGWGISVLCSRVCDEVGMRLFIPLLMFVAAAIGVTLWLERAYVPTSFQILVVPAVIAVVLVAISATVHQWINT